MFVGYTIHEYINRKCEGVYSIETEWILPSYRPMDFGMSRSVMSIRCKPITNYNIDDS